MKRTAIISIFLFVWAFGYSQSKRAVKRELAAKNIVYEDEFSVGGRLMTNGWSIFGERNKILSIYKTRVLQFEIQEFRHLKEKKQQPVDYYNISSFLESNKDYYFGKQNNFYALHFGYGYRKRIADKADKNGVRVSMFYLGGVSLGIKKPYYLEYIDSTYVQENTTVYIIVDGKYTSKNADKFLDQSLITSASGFGRGLNEIEPIPGLYGKWGLTFDWASNDQFVKALEVGLNLDIYYKKIPIMVLDDNKRYFLGLYLSFHFGKRW